MLKVEISAKTGAGIKDLMENIELLTETLELKALYKVRTVFFFQANEIDQPEYHSVHN